MPTPKRLRQEKKNLNPRKPTRRHHPQKPTTAEKQFAMELYAAGAPGKNIPPTSSGAPAAPPPPDPFDLQNVEWMLEEDVLIALAQRGLGAYSELARRHRDYMLRTAKAILRHEDDAEDAVQDSMLVAFTNLKSYKPTRGGFHQWLTGIVRKRSKTVLRDRDKTGAISLDQVEHVAKSIDAQQVVEQREKMTILAHAIQGLPSMQRACIELAAAGRMNRDISFSLGISPAAVHMNLNRARKKLVGRLAEAGYST